ncbi:MAG: aminotransferase class IV [Alphaproteobacteria bacterium]
MPNHLDSISHCLLNGKLLSVGDAALSVFDRGFSIADGLFETILIKNATPIWWQAHLARLKHGMKILHINTPIDDKKLWQDTKKLLAANHCQTNKNYVLRLTLSRGVFMMRGLWQKAKKKPTILLTLHHPSPVATSVDAYIATITRKNHLSPLSGIKWLGGYGDNILAHHSHIIRKKNNATQDILLLNGKDHLVSASTSNIFILLDDWQTPQPSDGIISGIARAKILQSPLITVKEKTIPLSAIKKARAAFTSNSLRLEPITTIDNRTLPDYHLGIDICQKLTALYCKPPSASL